jgi:hypothetical protein
LKVFGTKILGVFFFIKIQKFMMFEACATFVWCLKDHFYTIHSHFEKRKKKSKKSQKISKWHFWTNMASRLIGIDSTSISRHPSQKKPKKY